MVFILAERKFRKQTINNLVVFNKLVIHVSSSWEVLVIKLTLGANSLLSCVTLIVWEKFRHK